MRKIVVIAVVLLVLLLGLTPVRAQQWEGCGGCDITAELIVTPSEVVSGSQATMLTMLVVTNHTSEPVQARVYSDLSTGYLLPLATSASGERDQFGGVYWKDVFLPVGKSLFYRIDQVPCVPVLASTGPARAWIWNQDLALELQADFRLSHQLGYCEKYERVTLSAASSDDLSEITVDVGVNDAYGPTRGWLVLFWRNLELAALPEGWVQLTPNRVWGEVDTLLEGEASIRFKVKPRSIIGRHWVVGASGDDFVIPGAIIGPRGDAVELGQLRALISETRGKPAYEEPLTFEEIKRRVE